MRIQAFGMFHSIRLRDEPKCARMWIKFRSVHSNIAASSDAFQITFPAKSAVQKTLCAKPVTRFRLIRKLMYQRANERERVRQSETEECRCSDAVNKILHATWFARCVYLSRRELRSVLANVMSKTNWIIKRNLIFVFNSLMSRVSCQSERSTFLHICVSNRTK